MAVPDTSVDRSPRRGGDERAALVLGTLVCGVLAVVLAMLVFVVIWLGILRRDLEAAR